MAPGCRCKCRVPHVKRPGLACAPPPQEAIHPYRSSPPRLPWFSKAHARCALLYYQPTSASATPRRQLRNYLPLIC
eukprot:41189-Hanusia_phi.AAC.1